MLKEKCKHEWQKTPQGKYACLKCGEWEKANNVYQRESLKHKFGFEKRISVFAIIISIASLVVSIIALMLGI